MLTPFGRVIGFLLLAAVSGCTHKKMVPIIATAPPPPRPTAAARPPERMDLPPGVKGFREVFTATDRRPLGNELFANEAGDGQIHYGRTVVSIPASHQRGELERPWHVFSFSFAEDPKSDIMISARAPLAEASFFDGVSGAIDASVEKSAFVFVHGFNVSYDDAVLRTGQLAWDLDFKGPAITYSWPSAASTAGYVSDLDMADWTAPHLQSFLRELRTKTGSRTVHLIAHSMGTRVLGMALDRLNNAAGNPVRFQELVLAAPDINERVFEELATAMHAQSDRVTLYASSRDLALEVSDWIRRRNEPRTGAEAARLPALPGFEVIDATRARSSLLGHSYFAEDPMLLADIASVLKHLMPALRTASLQAAPPIWVFRP